PGPVAAPAPGETVRLSTMRRVIAERMAESKATVPHFYLTVDCEIDELLKVRGEINKRIETARVSVNDIVIRASALALREVPAANVSWAGEGSMTQHGTVDISVAVAIPGGLVTPIVRNADVKGLVEIATEMKALAARAREGKLTPEEYQGGSFSISNLGMYGVKSFDAVINPPQACILAVGAGEPRPVVRDGAVVPATVMSCTLSVDHRVVDGAIGAELLGAIKRNIEYPPAMLA
ncbi:MAG: 2-oxo acid dehydrogenase subunit E2, partial [Defluviicoccus sp.]|nr:2-oxo acid dehydrogenase subunit E2 [Defluviicoccus sp.]MDE0385266.1 2-oxo acid dehydrogenase subunit E2 [Defluviicoccus sp.]